MITYQIEYAYKNYSYWNTGSGCNFYSLQAAVNALHDFKSQFPGRHWRIIRITKEEVPGNVIEFYSEKEVYSINNGEYKMSEKYIYLLWRKVYNDDYDYNQSIIKAFINEENATDKMNEYKTIVSSHVEFSIQKVLIEDYIEIDNL